MSVPESFADLPLDGGSGDAARPTSLASLGGQAHPRPGGAPAEATADAAAGSPAATDEGAKVSTSSTNPAGAWLSP